MKDKEEEDEEDDMKAMKGMMKRTMKVMGEMKGMMKMQTQELGGVEEAVGEARAMAERAVEMAQNTQRTTEEMT